MHRTYIGVRKITVLEAAVVDVKQHSISLACLASLACERKKRNRQ